MSTKADLRMLLATPKTPQSSLDDGQDGERGPEDSGLPRLKTDIDNLNNDNTLFAVYCFIKNFIGASGTTTGAIDNKIEQAMDLVKTHLMLTVREEVEVLKDKITELMDRISQLEVENTILKAHASQETLSQLTSQASQKNQQPPSNNSA